MKTITIATMVVVLMILSLTAMADEAPEIGVWELVLDRGFAYNQSALLRLEAPSAEAMYTASVHQDTSLTAEVMHKSVNGGLTWQPIVWIEGEPGFCGMFRFIHMVLDVAFTDEMNGVRGGYGIPDWCLDLLPEPMCLACVFIGGQEAYFTEDGGETWTPSVMGPGPGNGSLTVIDMVDENWGYAGGQSGSFFLTQDGGRNWQYLGNPDPATPEWEVKVQSMQFLDHAIGYISTGLFDEDVEPMVALGADLDQRKVIEQATHWTRMQVDPGYRNAYWRANAASGESKGLKGKILKTTDGGLTWEVLRADERKMFTKVHFINEDIGFAIGESFQHATNPAYTLIRTEDGGESWQQVDLPDWQEIEGLTSEYWLMDIKFLREDLGFLVGDGQGFPAGRTVIFYTTDMGETWELDPFDEGNWDPLEIEFVGRDAYVVGQAFMTLHYSGVNSIPVADAGPDQTVPLGTTVYLDGTGSYDRDGEPLTYIWSQPDGPAMLLSDSTAVAPSFVATELGEVIFELIVADAESISVPDYVQIVIVDEEDGDDDDLEDSKDDSGDDDGNGCGCDCHGDDDDSSSADGDDDDDNDDNNDDDDNDDTGGDDDDDDDTGGDDDDDDDEPIEYDMGLLKNGDFEDGDAFWLQESGSGTTLIGEEDSAPFDAYSGGWLVWMGGYADADDELTQAIDLPSDAQTATLSCYFNVRSDEEPYWEVPYDFLYLKIRNSQGGNLIDVGTVTDKDRTGGNWTLKSFPVNVAAYAGTTIQIYLNANNDEDAHTDFFIDTCAFIVDE